MPKPQPQQASWAHQMSVTPPLALTQPRTAQIGRARRWLLKACRSVAEALSSTEGKATQLVRRWQHAPGSVPCRSHSLSKPRGRTK